MFQAPLKAFPVTFIEIMSVLQTFLAFSWVAASGFSWKSLFLSICALLRRDGMLNEAQQQPISNIESHF
jgi:hypothetical protein